MQKPGMVKGVVAAAHCFVNQVADDSTCDSNL